MSIIARGALAGWRRDQAEHGIVLTLQIASTSEAYARKDFEIVQIALNDRQIRSLARDCARAADDRGIKLWARKKRLTLLRFLGASDTVAEARLH